MRCGLFRRSSEKGENSRFERRIKDWSGTSVEGEFHKKDHSTNLNACSLKRIPTILYKVTK